MDVKCPVCEKLFPPSLITYHAEHCLYTSFNEKSNSNNKRSISEILEYESDVATATASYPRKRQHYGHSSTAPSTTASVAYYPKEPSEYRRVVSRQVSGGVGGGGSGGVNSGVGCSGSSSSVGASSLAPKEVTSWGGSGSVPLKASSSASIGSSSAAGWPTRKPVSSQDYRSATRLPPRRDSSSNVIAPQRAYIRAPPSGPPSVGQRVPSLSSSSSAALSGPLPSAPSAPVTHNYPKKGSSSGAPVAAVTVQRARPARPQPAQPPLAAVAAAVTTSATADGALSTPNVAVAKKTELIVPPRRLDRLYDLVRPCALTEVVGHEAVLGPRGALRASLEAATFRNTIVWGPAGCGKSTLGHILWRRCRQSGGSWRCHFLLGSAVATPELLQSLAAALAPAQGSNRCRTLLFVDELHCLAENVQVLLASSMDREDITLIGTCSQQPATCVSSSLVSRCEVYRLQRLLPTDLEVVVKRALGRVRCRVLHREAHGAEETPEQTRELDSKMIDGYYGIKQTGEDAGEVLQDETSNETFALENYDLGGGDSMSRVDAKNDIVIKSEPPVQTDNIAPPKTVSAKAAVVAPVAAAKKPPNDNGIEDMSDEEDESILDVLTKDLDQIGSEFNKIDHEMDVFRDEDPRRRKHVLKDLNDLDCVSDDDLPLDQRHTVDLESIDSSESEDQIEEEELSFTTVGMTMGAVACLSSRCSGDTRLALDVLQSLLEQAKERAAAVKAEQARARPNLPAPSSRQRGPRTHIGPKQAKGAEKRQATRREAGTRIANYGSSSSNRLERRVVYEKESALTTDDISSDEDNEVINARPESNGGTNGSRAKVDDLDNVSDVSDNSVHLLDGSETATNNNTSRQGQNFNKSLAVKAMDSDDVLSDALSEEDALDYEEIDMGEDAVSDVECASTEKPRPEPMAPEDESVSGTSFSNVVVVGRLSTMLFTKGRGAIAPNKVSKSNLKLNKRPIKNKLLYSNADLMKNASFPSSTPSQSSSPPKASLGFLEEIGDDLEDVLDTETQLDEDGAKKVHEGRPSGRHPGLVYAVITMRHVRQALQHRGTGTPAEQLQLSAALVASISSGHCEDALHCLARLLRAGQEPAEAASLLLQAAVSNVGIGDSYCLSAAVACVEAVKLLPPPHSHAALANTAALLARAPKDPSPALALLAVMEQLDSSAGPLPRHRT